MKITKITIAELNVLLSQIKGNPIASVEMVTSQKSKVSKTIAKLKNLNPDEFFKFSKIPVQLGSTYSTRVNNQRTKEGKENDFVAQLGNVIKISGALGKGAQEWNDAKRYAILTPNRNQKSESFYIYQNNKVDFSFIKSVFNPSSLKHYKSTTQQVDSDILHLTVMVNSITALVTSGVRYEIIQGK